MKRTHGVVESAAGLIPFGHLGWGFKDRAEFLARAAEYIADGLAQRQWVEYVGEGPVEKLRAELTGLSGLADLCDVKVSTAAEFYGIAPGADTVDPDVAVAIRCNAVGTAIEAGYTGFRAIVDATSVSRSPEQRDAFARFEFLIDQKMAELPVSALCAYDVSQLDDDASSLVCLHPFVDDAAPSFRLYAEPGASFAVNGEIDAAQVHAFAAALRRIWPLLTGSEIVVDASNLDFIGHAELLELDRIAAANDRRVILRDPQGVVARLVSLLEPGNVRIDDARPASR